MTQKVISIDSKFLLQDNNVTQLYDEYVHQNTIKSLIIKSPCGSGKTVLLSKLVKNYDTVLFISYRISLTQNLKNSFTDFKTYKEYTNKTTDKIEFAKKLIISPDSILRVETCKYQLIVIDEIEGVLNHLSADIGNLDKDKSKIYNTILSLCNQSDKTIVLDGDISERSLAFIKHLNVHNSVIINNNYTPTSYNFIQNNNPYIWRKKINQQLRSGKKVVVVSMSSKVCVSLYAEYFQQYNTKMYTAIHGDKKELIDVNTHWQCDLLLYSPCIEAGVDFNVIHFDSMFVFASSSSDLRHCSTSQRGLYQMIKRIRTLRSNDINIFTGNLKYTQGETPYTVQSVKNLPYIKMLMDVSSHDTVNLKEIIQYNMVESYNRIARLFLRVLIPFLQSKGHTWTDEEQKSGKQTNNNHDMEALSMIDLSALSKEDIQTLTEKYEEEGNVSTIERLTIEKYYLSKEFSTVDFNDINMIKQYRYKVPNIEYTKCLLHNKKIEIKTLAAQKHNSGIAIVDNIITSIFGENWKTDIVTNNGKLIVTYKYFDISPLKKKLTKIFNDNFDVSLIVFDVDKLKATKETDDDTTLGKDLLGKLSTIFDKYFIKMTSSIDRKKNKGKWVNKGAKYELTLDEHMLAIFTKNSITK